MCPTADSPLWRIRVPPELQHDGAPPVDHEVEPAVVPGHGEALVRQVRAHPDADQAHPGGGGHLPAHHGGTAAKLTNKLNPKFK